MGTLRSGGLCLIVALIAGCISGCGGHKPAGSSPFPAKVSLSPATSASVQMGQVFSFSASAQNSSNTTSNVTFTFFSTDTSILTLAPNGVACAGHWDAAFTTCTPGNAGVVQVTAAALGATSAPTYVFVHPPIDNIRVTGVLLNGIPVQEPCLSQGQSMTVEAHAYSQGSEITGVVGPFTWSANNTNVVKLTPLVNNTGSPVYPFATNQATATASTPGITQIFATASGVSSNTFYQPIYKNALGVQSPPLDFFETCLIQNITLELSRAGSQQTIFSVPKGNGQTAVATVTDVMGNSSIGSSSTPIVLTKIPLTWSASQPTVISTASGCTQSCAINASSPGAGSVTASCSPPTCNIGYPQVPQALIPGSQAASQCAQFFQLASCEQFIPRPVYSSPPPVPTPPRPVTAAISGLVTGATTSTSLLATSSDCQNVHPLDCSTAIYNVAISRPVAGNPTQLPSSPNSLLFDPTGTKAYMGSELGAISITPANFGSSSSPFNSIGTVTGKVLAVASSGNLAVFSDTQLTPNQVFIVNTAASAGSPSIVALNIRNASAAAFSQDGLRAIIFGLDSNNNPNLFVYSTIQALQTIPLPPNTTVNAIGFSTNNAFVYVVQPSRAGGGPAITVYNSCDNQIATDVHGGGTQQIISLHAPPVSFSALPDGQHFVALESDGTFDYITAAISGIPVATPTSPATYICPMTVSHDLTPPNISLGQGTISPIAAFASPDATLLYVLASDRPSVLVYNFVTGGVASGIELAGNATPVSGSISADGGTIAISASDGLLHEISTALGGTDSVQLTFPDLPNYLNPFCTGTPASGPCKLDLLALKP